MLSNLAIFWPVRIEDRHLIFFLHLTGSKGGEGVRFGKAVGVAQARLKGLKDGGRKFHEIGQ
jgi:hypothetical protein